MISDIEFHRRLAGFVYDLGVVSGQAESLVTETGNRLTEEQRRQLRALNRRADKVLMSLGVTE